MGYNLSIGQAIIDYDNTEYPYCNIAVQSVILDDAPAFGENF